ncbi:hypothetical protein SA2016_0872 [Sinomonas atrocyanea]|uniref:Uncharacterized protein n=1 Tax=Sinomonas atrocyanea TaxID=37927 RepID=A0A126ZWL3_9MICC|nr:hypothetical protein SA2016_0872 [Sinomonas atrocyanea]
MTGGGEQRRTWTRPPMSKSPTLPWMGCRLTMLPGWQPTRNCSALDRDRNGLPFTPANLRHPRIPCAPARKIGRCGSTKRFRSSSRRHSVRRWRWPPCDRIVRRDRPAQAPCPGTTARRTRCLVRWPSWPRPGGIRTPSAPASRPHRRRVVPTSATGHRRWPTGAGPAASLPASQFPRMPLMHAHPTPAPHGGRPWPASKTRPEPGRPSFAREDPSPRPGASAAPSGARPSVPPPQARGRRISCVNAGSIMHGPPRGSASPPGEACCANKG